MSRSTIIRDALARFPELPLRAVARYVLHNYGPTFDNNLEKIRSAIRYHIGSNGDYNRQYRIAPRTAPIRMPETWRKEVTPYKLNPGLWLVISDVHIPFHEPKAVEAAIKYGQERRVTGIFLNGDIQDCAAVSFWPSNMRRDFDKEVTLFIDFLDMLKQEFPNQEIVYKPGNHELRLPRLYAQKVPELIGVPLAAMESILGLEARNIEFLDYYQLVYAGKLPILHGHELKSIDRSVNPARGLFLRTKSYGLCGHCHTTSEHTERNIHGTVLTTWSVGCLSDLHPDFCTHGNNWNHGLAILGIAKNGYFEVENKRILPSFQVV
jgi:hypothetical protein